MMRFDRTAFLFPGDVVVMDNKASPLRRKRSFRRWSDSVQTHADVSHLHLREHNMKLKDQFSIRDMRMVKGYEVAYLQHVIPFPKNSDWPGRIVRTLPNKRNTKSLYICFESGVRMT